mmetsp:Transcript_85280/g.222534  ORF Transcript_85280/g.222534 Transcript_85280/m.222534 type:complete len:208 (-) Transcript_85280:19-642(-)
MVGYIPYMGMPAPMGGGAGMDTAPLCCCDEMTCLASRMRPRRTADGLRQSVRLPRSKTCFCVGPSHSRSCEEAESSILLSAMKLSSSSLVGPAPPPPLRLAGERDRSREAPRAAGELLAALRFSLATFIRLIRAALGFRQSVRSPRDMTSRLTSSASAFSASPARESTPDFWMNSSSSASAGRASSSRPIARLRAARETNSHAWGRA